MLLPLAVFTADNEQIFTGLPVSLGKKVSLSLANVAWYVLHVAALQPIKCSTVRLSVCSGLNSSLYNNTALLSISSNLVITKKKKRNK